MKKRPKRKSRSRFTESIAQSIVALINQWPANKRLTWEGIVSMTKHDTGLEWSRQTLQKQEPIRLAYDAHTAHYREYIRSGNLPKRISPENLVIQQKLDRVNSENDELRETLRRSDERLIRYLANAIRYGITQEQLESPVPKIVTGTEEE